MSGARIDFSTKAIFTIFTAIVLFLMHWNIRQLSHVNSGCITGHEETLNYLNDFKSSLLQSDLMVSFVDKSDLVELERERDAAMEKVSMLSTQFKNAQIDLVSRKTDMWLHSLPLGLNRQY